MRGLALAAALFLAGGANLAVAQDPALSIPPPILTIDQALAADWRFEDGPVICQIRMINEYPLIPDLEQVENLLHGYLADTGASVS